MEPSHPKHLELSNIEVVFLHENTTSLIQPMDPDLTLIEDQKQVSLLKHGGFAPKNDEELNPLHDVDIPVDMAPDDFERIVDQDVDAPVVGELTDQELIQASQPSNDNDDDESDEEDVEPPLREIWSL